MFGICLKYKALRSLLLRGFLFVSLGLLAPHLRGQDNISLKYLGFTWHPYGEAQNAFLMPMRLDTDAYIVINWGGIASYEKFFHKDLLSVKVLQGLYSDCACQFAGFSHIGVRVRVFRAGRHALYGGLGPTLLFRRNWRKLDGYTPSYVMKGGDADTWQRKFMWYRGELEYKYALAKRWDISATLIPGFPHVVNLSVGASYLVKPRDMALFRKEK